jgi:hypothetical protein
MSIYATTLPYVFMVTLPHLCHDCLPPREALDGWLDKASMNSEEEKNLLTLAGIESQPCNPTPSTVLTIIFSFSLWFQRIMETL